MRFEGSHCVNCHCIKGKVVPLPKRHSINIFRDVSLQILSLYYLLIILFHFGKICIRMSHCSSYKTLLWFYYNVCYLQCLILENNIQTFTVIDDFQRQNTVYAYQLKSFERNNGILFQVFLRKSEKLIIWDQIL